MEATTMLDGITVVDLSSVGPAARASRWLADYGAEVIKVGPVPGHGDIQITPPSYAYAAHRGMRRMLVDLKAESGRDGFLQLCTAVDVVLESYRPGVIDRLGIGYERLRAANEAIIVCSTSGYGQDGPRARWAGHDLNYLAVSGYLHCSGRTAQGGPALPGATVADSAAGGLQAVAAICAALVARSVTGRGCHLDVSVADGALSLMSLAVDEYLAGGAEPGPGHGLLTGRYAWYDVYPARDGQWLAVAAIEERFFTNLCRGIGCEQWLGRQYDGDTETMRADFLAAFGSRDRDEWVAELGPADACVSAVQDIPAVTLDPQYRARGAFVDTTHPTAGPLRQVGAVLAGQRDAASMAVPDMTTTDTVSILTGAGLSPAAVDELIADGVVA